MTAFDILSRQRLAALLLCCLSLILFLSACDSGGHESTESISPATFETASATFSIQWHDRSFTPTSEEPAGLERAAVNCTTAGIDEIYCDVYNESNMLIATGGPWQCADREGSIQDIPAGSGRKFVIIGEKQIGDEVGFVIYQGQKENITITPNENTNVGTIDAYLFVPTLTSPTSDPPAGDIELKWEPVPNAYEYRILVSEDQGFNAQSIHIEDITQKTSYILNDLLADTTYYWKVSAIDMFGNEGIESEVWSFVTSPCQPKISPTSSVFESNGDTGQIDVTVQDGCVWIATVDAGADWVSITSGKDSGSGTVVYSVAANTSPYPRSATITVAEMSHEITQNPPLDPTAPTVTILNPPPEDIFYTNSDTINIIGSANDDVLVETVTWNTSGGNGTCTSTDEWANWTCSITLSEGQNVITVTARDAAGNSGTDTVSVIYDHINPNVSITSPDANTITNNNSISIEGTASDNQGGSGVTAVRWSAGSSSEACTGTNSWTCNVTLSEGQNQITITARDAAGNTGTDSISVNYDHSAPNVTITSPAADTNTNDDSIRIAGTASDNTGVIQVRYSINGGDSEECTGTTNWSCNVPFTNEGTYAITITAADAAGNSGSDTVSVIYDHAAPNVSITSPENGSATNSNMISGTASDNQGGTGVTQVSYSINGGDSVNCTGTNSWTCSDPFTADGTYSITITARDAAGNESSAILEEVTYDSTGPEITNISPDPGTVSEKTITGQASDPRSVTGVYYSLNDGGNVLCASTNNWSNWSCNVPLAEGPNSVIIRAEDALDNTSDVRLSYTYVDPNG